jgi:hypothetical protein
VKSTTSIGYHDVRDGGELGSARASRAGLKAWPSLRVRCSGALPKQTLLIVDLNGLLLNGARWRVPAQSQLQTTTGMTFF